MADGARKGWPVTRSTVVTPRERGGVKMNPPHAFVKAHFLRSFTESVTPLSLRAARRERRRSAVAFWTLRWWRSATRGPREVSRFGQAAPLPVIPRPRGDAARYFRGPETTGAPLPPRRELVAREARRGTRPRPTYPAIARRLRISIDEVARAGLSLELSPRRSQRATCSGTSVTHVAGLKCRLPSRPFPISSGSTSRTSTTSTTESSRLYLFKWP